MRRTLLAILLLVILGAMVFLYINKKIDFMGGLPEPSRQQVSPTEVKPKSTKVRKLAETPLTSFFPPGPMIWIHLNDIKKIIMQIKKSNFYKQAIGYKLIDPSKPLPVNMDFDIPTNKKGVLARISSLVQEKTLMGFLEQEIEFAFYPPDNEGPGGFLFAAPISATTKIQEKLNRIKDSFLGGKGNVSEENYDKNTIITYRSQEQKISFHYMILKKIIMVSSSDILLKKGIDLMEKKGASRFAQSDDFKSLFKVSDLSAAGLLFVDIERATPYLISDAAMGKKVSSTAKKSIKKQLESIKHLGLTVNIQKGIEIKSTFTINQKKEGKLLIQAFAQEPREPKSLRFMPENVFLYGANIFEPAHFFDQLGKKPVKNSKSKKGFEKNIMEFFKKFPGISLKEDIIPFIGNEFFYSVSGLNKNSFFQIPNMSVGIEIKNTKKIERLLKKIQTRMTELFQQKPFQKEIYKGYNIQFLPFPIGIQPGYFIAKSFLFFSVNQAGIRQTIDALKGETPLLQKSKKYAAAKIPIKNNGMVYINASLLWEKLAEAIKKTPASSLPTPSEVFLENAIKALDVIQVIKSLNGVILYHKNQISVNTVILLEDLAKVKTDKELLAFLHKPGQEIVALPTPSLPVKTKVSISYTYDPIGKRDPFKSLIAGKLIKTKRIVQFFEKIKSLSPINLYIYNKIKNNDPVLFEKLKRHARFFKNKEKMEKASQEAKEEMLDDYSYLINIANTKFHDAMLTPLQSGYSSLRLVGTVRGKMGTIALIQTSDAKGYNIKVNDFMGPNYGKVKKIEKDKIVIIERYVSYLSEIIEKRQEIKLPLEEKGPT